jgi:tRNA(Ile)-lysidine synthase
VFDPQRIVDRLTRDLPRPQAYRVAFSGGLDSTVLLHLLGDVRPRLGAGLTAVHVDHGLQLASAGWAQHCRDVCGQLDIPLTVLCVDARAAPGQSPEAAARLARYSALAGLQRGDEMLLTAHHLDDQAETLLLQLLRGAGVEGLAAMPLIREWGDGWHARPLLDVARSALRAWAEAQPLDWIDDPSNEHTTADRNFLRHEVIPRLRDRWPAAAASLAHSAALCAEAAEIVRARAATDCAEIGGADAAQLRLQPLCELGVVRARGVLRHWLRERGVPPLPARRLREAVDQLCQARADAAVEIAWSGFALRRFRDQVWLSRADHGKPPVAGIAWTGDALDLGPGLGRVVRQPGRGGVDPRVWTNGRAEIRFRSAGLRCRPAGRRGSRSFKKIAQEYGIPPWQRDLLPLLFIDGQLAAVANGCVCEPFAVEEGATGWHLRWFPG